MSLSRRKFLLGTAAVAAAAALPVAVASPVPEPPVIPLFSGQIGTWQGVRIIETKRRKRTVIAKNWRKPD